MTKALRFGALVRVSTEKQEKQGESLRTQKTQLTEAVAQMGGRIARTYGGQEHGTAGWEKKEVQRLLDDAARSPRVIDAVIVAHPDRWSRDNLASESGLELLRRHGIRFFVLGKEYDLYEPQARLFLSLSTTIGAYQAGLQKQKSLQNRIHRAKRGIPTCGKLPFGRTFDKTTGQWGIDAESQAMIVDVAGRYLKGESLSRMADEYGVNHANLHKVLTQRCGTQWVQRFKSDDLNIDEEVTIEVPPLLPDATIKTIRRTAQANKTYRHGRPKSPYLFGGMVFCGMCGYGLFGQTNKNGQRYYRHAHTKRARKCPWQPRPWVRCDDLDDWVTEELFLTLGNLPAIERALDRAIPNQEKVAEYRKRRQAVEDRMEKLKDARQRLVRLTARGSFSDDEVESELAQLTAEDQQLRDEHDNLGELLEGVPTPQIRHLVAQEVAATYRPKTIRDQPIRLQMQIMAAYGEFDEMTWQDKRALAEKVFSGHTADGKPMGVYVMPYDSPPDGKRRYWNYKLVGTTPPRDERLVALYPRHSPGTGLPGCHSA